ncbi:MAG: 50S ribosomal protein L10 [Clostridia bacterium]|nr:50S ribosomal protein L10 [Clostridia bacterium]
MPSTSVLEAKQAVVAELKEKVLGSAAGVLVDYKGINAEDDTKLRKELREAGVNYSVIKNTLLKRAIEGSEIEDLSSVLEGTTALAIATDDQIAPARILNKFAKDSDGKFVIKAGYMDGKVMSAAEVAAIADLPSKEGLVQMLLSVLVSGPRGLAVAINAIAEKNAAPAEEAAAE